MSKTYRIALVGCGDIAETGHVPALMSHPRFRLVTLCDVRAERAQFLAQRAGGVPVTNDYRTLLDRADIDAVILALHPEVSVNVAIEFLRHGKPVLGEKPLARNLDDGRRLIRAVEETRGIYQIGFVFGYTDLVRTIATYSQRIGAPAIYRVAIYDEFLDRNNHEHFGRIQHALKNSSAITHEGSHVVDFTRLWNPSKYVRASAAAVKTAPDFNGPNLWSARLTMSDGSMLAVEIGWAMPDLLPCEAAIQGPGGAVRIDLRTGIGEWRQGGKVEAFRTAPMTQPWDRQLETFAQAIDAGASTIVPVERGFEALLATQACERSAASGQMVEIDSLR